MAASDYSDSDADEPELVKIVLKKRKRVVDSDEEEHELDGDDSSEVVRAIDTSFTYITASLWLLIYLYMTS